MASDGGMGQASSEGVEPVVELPAAPVLAVVIAPPAPVVVVVGSPVVEDVVPGVDEEVALAVSLEAVLLAVAADVAPLDVEAVEDAVIVAAFWKLGESVSELQPQLTSTSAGTQWWTLCMADDLES